MVRIPRRHQKVFAENATNNGVFGSLQAGNPTKSNDLAEIQSLDAYSQGWLSATSGSANLPPLEEFQALQYLASKQLCYMFQEGIPEWDADCTYYVGSIAKIIDGNNFRIYCSIADDNKGNITSDTSKWKLWFDSTSFYVIESQMTAAINAHNTDLNAHSNKFVVVNQLPANPVANTFYFIKA